ncbi:GTPase, partial [Streptomyces sp. SID10244]|nr:GTPase [Streptomyces sp. SID10244]
MNAPRPVPRVDTDPVHATLDHGLHQLAALGGDLAAHANAIGTILWSPPRVVVVGRLKAGKSTLVNALIGAPVAETAALEA